METCEVLVLSRRELAPCSSSSSLASVALLPPTRERKGAKLGTPSTVEKKKKRKDPRTETQTGPVQSVETAVSSCEFVDSPDKSGVPAASSLKTPSGSRMSSKRGARGRGRALGAGEDDRLVQVFSPEPVHVVVSSGRERGNEGQTQEDRGQGDPHASAPQSTQRTPEEDDGQKQANRGTSRNRRRKEERGGDEAMNLTSAPVDNSEEAADSATVAVSSHVSGSSSASSHNKNSRRCPDSPSLCAVAASETALGVHVSGRCRVSADSAQEGPKEGKGRARKGKKESQGGVRRNAGSDRDEKKKEEKGDAAREKLSRASLCSASLVPPKERKEEEKHGRESAVSPADAGEAKPKKGLEEQEKRRDKHGKTKKKSNKKDGLPSGSAGTSRSRKGEKKGEEREDREEQSESTQPGEETATGEKPRALSRSLLDGEPQGDKKKKKPECSTPPLRPAQPAKLGVEKTQTSRDTKKRNDRRSTEGVSSLSPSFSPAFTTLSPARTSRSLPSSSVGREEEKEEASARYEPPSVWGCVPTRHSEPRMGVSLCTPLGSIRFGGLSSALSASTSFLLQSLVQRQEAARQMKTIEGGGSAQGPEGESQPFVEASAAPSCPSGAPSRMHKPQEGGDENREGQKPPERDGMTQELRPRAGSSELERTEIPKEKGAKTLFFSRRDGTLDSFFYLLGSMPNSSSTAPASAASSRPPSAVVSSPLQDVRQDAGKDRDSPAGEAGEKSEAAPVSPTSFLLGLLTRRSSGRGVPAESVGERTGRKGQAGLETPPPGRLPLSVLLAPESGGGGIATQKTNVRGYEGMDETQNLEPFKGVSSVVTHTAQDPVSVRKTNTVDTEAKAVVGPSATATCGLQTLDMRTLGSSRNAAPLRVQPAGPLLSPSVPYAGAQASPSTQASTGGLLAVPSTLEFPLGRTKSAPSGSISALQSISLLPVVRLEVASPPGGHPGRGREEQRGRAFESQRCEDQRESHRHALAQGIPSSPSSTSSRSSSVFVVGSRGSVDRRGADMSRRILPASLVAEGAGNIQAQSACKDRRRAGMRRSASVETVVETETRERAARRKEGRVIEKVAVKAETAKAGSREFAAPSFMAIPFPHEVPPPPFLRM
ncbi:hypothetical protein TGVEG_214980 [Toxoplasma gondii VEG]|uniref:Uncharacterized protein n=1 Tax=Toxoplasma gondii (strain ATCC 50861 / VEG) TaxID=432359 RepID=B9QN66_TOXGV|nr:hypothetical protein TGVEG_214980 [Toxoplasma gondii VEG]CEL77079.1 TPA: hypothetical protein BN1205_030910 [Toxoplasma gondii VEG]